METSNLLTPPPARSFVPAVVTRPPTAKKEDKKAALPKAQPQLQVVRDFTVPGVGLFHRAARGRAVHRWETLAFILLGASAAVSIGLALLGL